MMCIKSKDMELIVAILIELCVNSNEKLQMALFYPPGLDSHDGLQVHSWA